MSDHEINVKVNLDDSEAQKKLNDLTKKERKIDIDVDTSDIDQASKKVDGLKNKDVKVDAKTKDSITISWTASTDNVGVKGYKILVDGMEKADVTEGTTCTITGLEPGT